MYDAPDNQVVYLPCILPFMKQTAHFIINGRIVHLAEFPSFADDKYVGIDLLNLFDNMFFNVPRTCCCSWLCLLIYFEVIRKKTSEKRTRPRVCTVVLLLIRCTVKKQQKNSGFVRAPRKSARTVRNRGFVRFIHTVCRGEKRCCTVFPTESGAALQKNRSTGNRAERTVRYITAPNRNEGFTISENRPDPHRRIPNF